MRKRMFVSFPGGTGFVPPGTDKAETQDVAAQYPKEVDRLKKQWHQWAKTHQVLPKPTAKR